MSLIRIHCWGCARSLQVDEHDAAGGLDASGWWFSHGETYCPQCVDERKLLATPARVEPTPARAEPTSDTVEPTPARVEPTSDTVGPTPGSRTPDGTEAGESRDDHRPAAPPPHLTPAGGYPSERQLEPFAVSAFSDESRMARSLRMLGASFTVLRENPSLAIFPVISFVLSLLVGVVCFGSWTPHGSDTSGAREALLVPSLIAAYPLSFISVYCSVALAEMLGGRLDGRSMSFGDGFSAANRRIGPIAAWSLLACTVGVALKLLEQRLPLAGRIAASVFGLAWSLVTLFAIPVLAYEGRGPLATVERSTQIFKRRWGSQIGGNIGIGLAGVLLAVPLLFLLFAGIATSGGGGAAIVTLAGAGLFALFAGIAALEQIYRVFVYRSAVGLDTSGGPFSQSDLRSPLSGRRR